MSMFPVFAQLLILEFAIDGLKLAAINTPGMLTTPTQCDRRSCCR